MHYHSLKGAMLDVHLLLRIIVIEDDYQLIPYTSKGTSVFKYCWFVSSVQMVFEGNTAYNGLALFANSFTACLSDSSKFLNNLHGKVAQSGQARSAKFFSGGVWMTLESVGCDCLKTIPSSTGKHWLLHRGCSHEQIYREANTNRYSVSANSLDLSTSKYAQCCDSIIEYTANHTSSMTFGYSFHQSTVPYYYIV